jgi:hypothetical protein
VVSAGEKVVTERVKRVVAVMTGFGGELGWEYGQAKAAAEEVGVGKAVVRVLAGKIVKGDSHHGLAREGRLARTWAGVEGQVAKRS